MVNSTCAFPRLLHIDASPRGDRSHSRRLTREFVEAWKKTHSTATVTYRDIGRNPIPHVTEDWIAAAFTPSEKLLHQMQSALHLSDELVDEFLAADIYVMGVPMYNWSVTSGFKAYIDNIVRINRTWAYIPDENPEFPYKPLVHGKKMFVIASRGDGGFAPGERNHQRDFQTPLIKEAFGMLGVTDITFITVENDEYGGQKLADSIASARTQIAELISV
ncbi:FMN-dependent NADH-azoreductase 2 [Hyella patelloides LEGE 07179]|uniref:FMN dependent NADH:quinone oxidoreductase n=1 Tax=Hyella patelloides LEGE 07179 TaxID=945734 RepID=A0A563VSX9_9CYAN|nr:NAD(P)H-dependent oxidoreductase [Hyella patelloides]VEP14576.1 FMN-dependent NADH-azoreductase 2 [Hyella patelloides LEGE 07179]